MAVLGLEQLDDSTLYDVFYEAGTMLGGRLIALERKASAAGDARAARRWRGEHMALDRERIAVPPYDRDAQINAMTRWDTRRKELEALL